MLRLAQRTLVRDVTAMMNAAGLAPQGRSARDAIGDLKHVGEFQRRLTRERRAKVEPPPETQARQRRFQRLFGTFDPDVTPHQGLERVHEVAEMEFDVTGARRRRQVADPHQVRPLGRHLREHGLAGDHAQDHTLERELDPSRFAPCRPELATSPHA